MEMMPRHFRLTRRCQKEAIPVGQAIGHYVTKRLSASGHTEHDNPPVFTKNCGPH